MNAGGLNRGSRNSNSRTFVVASCDAEEGLTSGSMERDMTWAAESVVALGVAAASMGS